MADMHDLPDVESGIFFAGGLNHPNQLEAIGENGFLAQAAEQRILVPTKAIIFLFAWSDRICNREEGSNS